MGIETKQLGGDKTVSHEGLQLVIYKSNQNKEKSSKPLTPQ